MSERMDHYFAVFNLHVNQAGERADAEFKAQFGETAWDKHIRRRHDEGIMSIFNKKPSREAMIWIALVTAYVNEPQVAK